MSESEAGHPMRICFVLTSPLALNAFLLGHLTALAEEFQVTVCVNALETPVSDRLDRRVELLSLPISRPIAPLRDLACLVWLMRLFRARRFDAVHTVTPKAGLLGMLAAQLCGVRLRTHTFTGQVWATRRGFSRALLVAADKLLAACATDLQADSASQARFLEDAGVCAPGRIRVFGHGSISGVDLNRFSRVPGRRDRVRAELGLGPDSVVFVYLGRLGREKGIPILAEAFSALTAGGADCRLLLVGRDEEGLAESVSEVLGDHCRVVGLTSTPEDYLDAADVLCLPSFREGFGTVIIEAAAMGIPAVASRIYGLTDAVVEGETGLLCAPGDSTELASVMEMMFDGPTRLRLGRQAQARARTHFSAEILTGHWLEYYRQRLLR